MKKINDFINEKLKVTKNSASDTTKIPVAITNADKVYSDILYVYYELLVVFLKYHY